MRIPFFVLATCAGWSALISASALVKLIQTSSNPTVPSITFIVFSGITVSLGIVAIVRGIKE